jgi:phage-related protein|tara:strand:- start:111 stop:1067 length:957 start_codon:yes stop_codon:yes gene_type:complete
MSESLFYNRDNNISGIAVPSTIGALGLTPVYGSQVDFEANNHSYATDDFYYNLVPYSVNSLTAKFNVRYDVNETNAQKLAVFFENQSGVEDIPFTPDSSNIYKTVTGFCNNYAINFINNQHYEVASTISVDHAPTLLKWSGMGCFANLDFNGWTPSSSYKEYNVIYSGINQNKLDNFYYCTGDHTSTETNSPTGTGSMWSQNFFFEPDIGTQNNVVIKADVLEYKNSFRQRIKTNDNISTFNINYTFSNISDSQTKSMIHFLENKGGYRRFEHQIPSVYNRPKVYYCPKWTHTWNYVNSNTLTVEFVEDPLGVIPTGT